jgi:hypothetical protein
MSIAPHTGNRKIIRVRVSPYTHLGDNKYTKLPSYAGREARYSLLERHVDSDCEHRYTSN